MSKLSGLPHQVADSGSVPRYRYAYAGLTIASMIELPELEVFSSQVRTVAPDVTIAVTETMSEGASPDVFSSEVCRFTIPHVGRYAVLAGRRIEIARAPQVGLAELRLFLLGTAWAALLYQRGWCCLHASAVELPEGVVAFCGASGAGKSSLCAALVSRGARFVADDLARVAIRSGTAHIFPSAPRMKLWRDSIQHIDPLTPIIQRDHFRLEKFHVLAKAPASSIPYPLKAVCLLEWGEHEVEYLRGKSALTRMVRAATYRPGLLEPIGTVGRHWQNLLDLLGTVRVLVLRRPKDWTELDAALVNLQNKLKEMS